MWLLLLLLSGCTFECGGKHITSISATRVCDGEVDCWGGGDERADDCETELSWCDQPEPQAVLAEQVCDGVEDCNDGADEAYCAFSGWESCEVVLTWDHLLDGTPDEIIESSYDEIGRLVAVRWDIDGSGSIDQSDARTWDGPRLMGRELDLGHDGSVDETWAWGWGNAERVWEEHAHDGVVDRTTWTWEDGREREAEVDEVSDGTVDHRWTWAWEDDSEGSVETITRDLGDDGTADEVDTVTRDPEGKVLESTHDEGADGAIELRETRGYDAWDRLLRRDVDYLADGALESRFWYHYDDLDRPSRWELDSRADGEIDGEATYDYACP